MLDLLLFPRESWKEACSQCAGVCMYLISSMLQRSHCSPSGKGRTPFPFVILPVIVSLLGRFPCFLESTTARAGVGVQDREKILSVRD